jgi:ABC-type branched-subunit amino acid transport system substrate-binding protein
MVPTRKTTTVILLVITLAVGIYGGYILSETTAMRGLSLQIDDLKFQISSLNGLLQNADQQVMTLNNDLQQARSMSLNGKTIQIGFISTTLTQNETAGPLFKKIIEPDINVYARKLGYNVTFRFICRSADFQVDKHLEIVKDFKSHGIDLVLGGDLSSMAEGSLSYVNENNMVMISPESSLQSLAIANDGLFRMSPPDDLMVARAADAMWSYGIKSVIILYRNGSWEAGFVDSFKPAWEALGGRFAGDPINYDAYENNYTSYLRLADQQASLAVAEYGGMKERVGVLALDDVNIIAIDAMGYPNVYDVPWFSGEYQSFIGVMSVELSGLQADSCNHTRWIGILVNPPETSRYLNFISRYESLVKQRVSPFVVNCYDAAWVLARSVLESESTDGLRVRGVLPDVCSWTYGLGGWCRLDENGDRLPESGSLFCYRIRFNDPPDGGFSVRDLVIGSIDFDSHTVFWDRDSLGYSPLGP